MSEHTATKMYAEKWPLSVYNVLVFWNDIHSLVLQNVEECISIIEALSLASYNLVLVFFYDLPFTKKNVLCFT